MELCANGSLHDVMHLLRTNLQTEIAIATACRDSLRGLAYLHTHRYRIIHRDIKCANLLLSGVSSAAPSRATSASDTGGPADVLPSDRPAGAPAPSLAVPALATCNASIKLADFGVAAQLNSTASKRSSVIGTPHWMAPEVVQNGKYDVAADIWSLGIAAMEMAQVQPPLYDMRPVLRVMFAIAANPPPKLMQPECFSAEFNAFLARCLTYDAKARPNAETLLSDPFIVQSATDDGLNALLLAADGMRAFHLANPDAAVSAANGRYGGQAGTQAIGVTATRARTASALLDEDVRARGTEGMDGDDAEAGAATDHTVGSAPCASPLDSVRTLRRALSDEGLLLN